MRWMLTLGLCAALLAAGPRARSQDAKPADNTPKKADNEAPKNTPPEPKMGDRLREVEESNRRLAEQVRQLLDRNGTPAPPAAGDADVRQAAAAATSPPGDGPIGTALSPVPAYLDLDITSPNRIPLRASFGPGFQLQSEDARFRLQVHYESQIEGRVWGNADILPVNNGFYLPRQRIFFNGNITEPIEYEFAINRGLNNLNLLNAWLNFHFDDSFEVRVGRYFVPLLYEQYAVSNYWLLTPERSLYSTNVGLNRQFGLMAWGYLLDKRLDYAAGVFNGTRNSFENLDKTLDFVGFLNARPFQTSEALPWLRFLNVGSSVAYGRQDTPTSPTNLRLGAGSPDTNIPGGATVPFLAFNPDVVERGDRLQGSVHAAYYFKGLSLLGEWQYGYGTYATPTRPAAQVPLSGFYVGAGYFLTGEEVEQRTRVKPLRPLVPLNDDEQRGFGAVEAVARVSKLSLGEKVFAGGFADANVWSNSATTTELGLNWYWNDYVKFYTFWLHGEFGDPVQFKPGVTRKTADMFWLRSQLYF